MTKSITNLLAQIGNSHANNPELIQDIAVQGGKLAVDGVVDYTGICYGAASYQDAMIKN